VFFFGFRLLVCSPLWKTIPHCTLWSAGVPKVFRNRLSFFHTGRRLSLPFSMSSRFFFPTGLYRFWEVLFFRIRLLFCILSDLSTASSAPFLTFSGQVLVRAVFRRFLGHIYEARFRSSSTSFLFPLSSSAPLSRRGFFGVHSAVSSHVPPFFVCPFSPRSHPPLSVHLTILPPPTLAHISDTVFFFSSCSTPFPFFFFTNLSLLAPPLEAARERPGGPLLHSSA